MGIIATFQGYVRIEKMYLRCVACGRQSKNDNYYYHHYYYLKRVGGYLKTWEILHGYW